VTEEVKQAKEEARRHYPLYDVASKLCEKMMFAGDDGIRKWC